MKYFFKHWDNIKKYLTNRNILLFLDYDGTLTPIVGRPEKAVIGINTKGVLERLSKLLNCKIAIISGRALVDIRRIVGLKNIIYSGTHGLEIEGPRIKFRNPIPSKYKSTLKKIKNKLEKELSQIKGVLIEDKGLSLSLHYRLVGRDDMLLVKTIFYKTVINYLVKNEIKVSSGKMVFEVRPPIEWDKGKIVLWLLAKERFIAKDRSITPIYIGDDLTDEGAFNALNDIGITIYVGFPKKSNARFYLKNTKEVNKFLKSILDYGRINKG